MPFEGEGEDDGAAVNDLLPDATIAVELRSSELLLTPEEARAGNVLCLRAIELSPIPEARSIPTIPTIPTIPVLSHAGSRTTAFAWRTPILKDFSQHIS